MDSITQDLKCGYRRLVTRPAFCGAAILTLALGIGAATTIFSVLQNVLLDPAPYMDAKRLAVVQIQDLANARPAGRTTFTASEFLDYQEHITVFQELMGGGREDVVLAGADGTETLSGGFVTPNAFEFLGVPAIAGRGLLPHDGRPGSTPVFVMSYKMWHSHFGGDFAIIGQAFTLDGVPTTLVGIMPSRFAKYAADIWRPVRLDRSSSGSSRRFVLEGRLKRGVTLEQASHELDQVAHRFANVHRGYPDRFAARVVSWVDNAVGQFKATLHALAAAVGLLLFIACGNVANMLLANGADREKEIALRLAVGASRWRVVRQLLFESAYLACGGAVLGVALAELGVHALIPLLPVGLIPSEVVIRLNVPVLIFALVLAVATTIASGLLPALQTVRSSLVPPLRESGRGVTGSARGTFRSALIVVEVALSLVLLLGAGLLMQTVVALQRVDLGFDRERLAFARLPLSLENYDEASEKQRFFEAAFERIRLLPGVVAVAATTGLPPYGGISGEVDVAGQAHQQKWDALIELCSEDYFTTLGVPLLRGRPLSHADMLHPRRTAVVNQAFVDQYVGHIEPLGRPVTIPMLGRLLRDPVKDPTFEIVGVVANAKNRGVKDSPMPQVFIPYTTTGEFDRSIMVRTSTDPQAVLPGMQREIKSIDRSIALGVTATLPEYLKVFSYAAPRLTLIVLAAFAGVGLVLVVVGVFGVIAYTVSQRTQEIGVRMAMGATPGGIQAMVMWMGARLFTTGIPLGLLASFATARMIQGQLWAVTADDPVTMACVAAVLLVAGLGACYVPARRATRVDPIKALHAG